MLVSVAMLETDIERAGEPGRIATGAANWVAGDAGIPELEVWLVSGGA